MSGITLTISLGDMPVDKMEENEEGMMCPPATQDSDLNVENKDIAIEEADYRDGDVAGFRPDKVCGNCAAYNQSPKIMECIGDDSADPELGYCQIYKFVCQAYYTCNSWAEGGPIIEDADESYDYKKDIM